MKRSILDAVRKERGGLSNNQLAKKLVISKRELLTAYKLLDRESVSRPVVFQSKNSFQPSRYISRLRDFFASPIKGALVVFSLAVLIRLSVVIALRHTPLLDIPILDADYYSQWAQKIVSGAEYPPSAFFVEPGYAYIVAFFYKLFGVQSLPIILSQILLGGLSAVCLFWATLKLTGSRLAGYVAGFGMAFFSVSVFYDILLLKTSVEFFLLSLVIAYLAHSKEEWTMRRALGLGILLGVTALIKANILYVVPFLLLLFIARSRPYFAREKLFVAGVFVAGFLVVIAPVTIRNFMVSHAFVPINSSGGANLYIGNWEGADGALKPPEYISTVPAQEESDWRGVAESYEKRPLNPAEVSSFWTKKTLSEIAGHPGTFIKNTFWKTFLLLNAQTLGDDYDRAYVGTQTPLFYIAAVPNFLVLAMGFFGMILILLSGTSRRKYASFLVIVGAYAATLVVSHVTDRYRVALLPFFFLFSGYAIVWVKEQIYERDLNKLFIAGLAVIVFSLVALIPPAGISGTTGSDMLVNFGGIYEQEGNTEKARMMYEQSLKLNGDHIPTLGKLARRELLDGNYSRAIELYRKALRIQTEFPADELYVALDAQDKHLGVDEVHGRLDALASQKNDTSEKYDVDATLGVAFIRKQDYENAVPVLEKAMQKYPQSVSVLSNLATAYKNTKKTDQAITIFKKLLDAHPEAIVARFNYANLLSDQKAMLPAAILQYEEINRAVPGFYISRYYLGLTYVQAGQGPKAIQTLQTFIDEAGSDPAKQALVSKAEDALKKLKGN